MWCELQAQLAGSPDLSGANKIKAHQTIECVRMGKLTFEQYLGNGLADVAAVVAGEMFQEPATILTSAEADVGLAVLLNLRLATIEAHCWIAAASKRVPRPLFPNLPTIEEDVVPLARARKKLRSIGHRLYPFKSGLQCLRCQKYRSHGRSHMWTKIPCIRTTPSSSMCASTPATTPDTQVTPPVRSSVGSFGLDAPEGEPGWFDTAADHGQASSPCAVPDSDIAIDEARDLISVSAAQRARKSWRQAKAAIVTDIREQATTASRLAAQQLAAGSREQALTVDFDPTACPPWASLAHSSHDLLWLGGFLFCGYCGSTAVTAINSSKLVSQCRGQFTVRGRQAFTRLCAGKIPHGFSAWPDGGASLRDGAEIKRVRQLA